MAAGDVWEGQVETHTYASGCAITIHTYASMRNDEKRELSDTSLKVIMMGDCIIYLYIYILHFILHYISAFTFARICMCSWWDWI